MDMSSSVEFQELKYGMQLFYYQSWESHSYTFGIPYISKKEALLFALKLNLYIMMALISIDMDEEEIVIKFAGEMNVNTVTIRDYDSLFVEIHHENG